MSKVLIDTNIFVYSIDRDSKYFDQAQSILNNPDLDLFTTSKNISELLSVITRLPKADLTVSQALELVAEFSHFTHILYPTSLSNHIFFELLKKYQPVGLKIHDFEIMSISLANRISLIASINKRDYQDISEIQLYKM
ncbi:MAG: type II toxin-antitoxin system VapC family toxin [candidate division KSB1 bacterium]|nr:type II toxin-antitoxin system VapC family toxin [candidate division KSB1 bacterium]